jgi:hypothetical protein
MFLAAFIAPALAFRRFFSHSDVTVTLLAKSLSSESGTSVSYRLVLGPRLVFLCTKGVFSLLALRVK